jgi:hypothetical protein
MDSVGIDGKNSITTNFRCTNVEGVNLIELIHGFVTIVMKFGCHKTGIF